jgi:hypothetical protein
MTATRTHVDPHLAEAVEQVFDDLECCMCPQLATARATCLPCGHQAGYCATHRTAVQRTMRFLLDSGQPPPCGITGCGIPVEAVAWGRL